MSHMGFAKADHGKVGLLTFKELAGGTRLVPIQKRAPLRHKAATGPQAYWYWHRQPRLADRAVRQLPEQSPADPNAQRCD